MDLLEYQGKQLFAKHGVPVPDGRHATTVEEAVKAADELGYPVVIKAQVQIGGRGKAGGIQLAADAAAAEKHASAILGMDIRGFTVHEVWVEKASEIDEEYYAAVVFDRSAKKPMAMLSRMGGMDVEEVAETDPEAMRMLHVDPLIGFQDFHGRRLAYEAGIAADVIRPVGAMLGKLYDVFVAEDATLVEVNPLLITKAREVVALDAKVTIDDNALFRHPDVAELRDVSRRGRAGADGQGARAHLREARRERRDPRQRRRACDVDSRRRRPGGRAPANFLDAGGGSKAEAITSAVEVILSDKKVTAVLFNIFGGITRCDEVARGLIEAFDQIKPTVPFVVRLDGTNDVEGRQLLADAALPNVHTESTMLGAAEKVVELAA